MAGKNTAVFGIYRDRQHVEAAVDALLDNGFRSEDISVLLPDNVGTKDFAHEKNTKAPEGASPRGARRLGRRSSRRARLPGGRRDSRWRARRRPRRARPRAASPPPAPRPPHRPRARRPARSFPTDQGSSSIRSHERCSAGQTRRSFPLPSLSGRLTIVEGKACCPIQRSAWKVNSANYFAL